MFQSIKLLSVTIFIISFAGPVSANRVKTFLPEKSWQISIDVNGFEPFEFVSQGTLLAGQTKDGIVVTIIVRKTKPGTIPSAVQSNHSQSILSRFGKMETMEQLDDKGMTIIMCQWDQPHVTGGIDAPFSQVGFAIRNRWNCSGYLAKDDVSFDIHLSADIKKHSRKQLLDMIRTVRIESSTEMNELQKLYESISDSPQTEGDSATNQKNLVLIRNFLKKYPANSDVTVLEGNCYWLSKQVEPAEKTYLKAIESHKLQPMMSPFGLWQCYLNLGIAYVNSKDFANAQKYLEKAYLLSKGQNSTQTVTLSTSALAFFFAEKGDPNNSVKYLIKAIELDENFRKQAQTDSSFKRIRNNPKFKEVISLKPKQNEPKQKTWSNSARMWALGCAAVLNERNGGKHDTLSPYEITPENIKTWKNSLDRWWNDRSREDLLGSLDWLEKGGHRRRFEYVGEYIEGLSKEQYGAILESNVFELEQFMKY